MIWEGYARIDPKLDDNPRVTQTDDRHPGDPLNVELIGTSLQLEALMKAAGLYTAAALGIVSDLEIAADTVFSRPDETAPVSSLYLFGRKEDFAFEQSRGDNPRHRHHVRFCQTNDLSDGRGKGVRTNSVRHGCCLRLGSIPSPEKCKSLARFMRMCPSGDFRLPE